MRARRVAYFFAGLASPSFPAFASCAAFAAPCSSPSPPFDAPALGSGFASPSPVSADSAASVSASPSA